MPIPVTICINNVVKEISSMDHRVFMVPKEMDVALKVLNEAQHELQKKIRPIMDFIDKMLLEQYKAFEKMHQFAFEQQLHFQRRYYDPLNSLSLSRFVDISGKPESLRIRKKPLGNIGFGQTPSIDPDRPRTRRRAGFQRDS